MAPGEIVFELTQEEAQVAGSRAAWRASLQGGLIARHLGPLAAFMLAVLFAAILGWTGLVSRRAAEIALIVAAAAYMAYRLWTRRRFLLARRAALAWTEALRASSRLSFNESGFRLEAPVQAAWLYKDGLEVEAIAGLVYVWPSQGWPLVWPSRAYAETDALLAYARTRTRQRVMTPSVDDDDD